VSLLIFIVAFQKNVLILHPLQIGSILIPLNTPKKYKLDFTYPQAVKVDASAPEATLECGILKTDLKIVDWADAASQHAEILSNHQSILKARGIKGLDENGAKVAKKQKSAPNVLELQASESHATKPALQAQQAKKRAPTQAAVATLEPQQNAGKLSSKKRSRTVSLVPTPPNSNPLSPDPASSPAKLKKKKRFLEKSEMSQIVGKIVEAAESKSDVRLHRDEADSSHLDEVIQTKKQKQEKRKKRKLEARSILQKAIKRKSAKTKTQTTDTGRKVMFA